MEPPAVGRTARRLALRMRESELETLTDRLFALILRTMPDYPTYASSLTSADLHAATSRNLDQMLGEITRVPSPEETPDRSPLHETGRRRARQGVPLESLLYAFRLGGRVLWEGLVREASRSEDPADPQRLLEEAVVVWEVIDHSSTIVAKAYRDEQARHQRQSQRRREGVLSTLVQGRALAPAAIAEAGDVLGIRAGAPLLVVTSVMAATTAGEPAPAPEVALELAGFTSAWVSQGAQDSGLVALPTRAEEARALDVLTELLPGPAAVSPVIEGLEHVAEAHRVASLTLRTLPKGASGLVRTTDRLAQTLLASTPEVARVLAQHHLGPVLGMRPALRDTYFDTVEAIVRAGGSYSTAARELFCHRNTVIKRMRRLEELTGHGLDDRRVLFDLHLAVLAARLGLADSRAEEP